MFTRTYASKSIFEGGHITDAISILMSFFVFPLNYIAFMFVYFGTILIVWEI